ISAMLWVTVLFSDSVTGTVTLKKLALANRFGVVNDVDVHDASSRVFDRILLTARDSVIVNGDSVSSASLIWTRASVIVVWGSVIALVLVACFTRESVTAIDDSFIVLFATLDFVRDSPIVLAGSLIVFTRWMLLLNDSPILVAG